MFHSYSLQKYLKSCTQKFLGNPKTRVRFHWIPINFIEIIYFQPFQGYSVRYCLIFPFTTIDIQSVILILITVATTSIIRAFSYPLHIAS